MLAQYIHKRLNRLEVFRGWPRTHQSDQTMRVTVAKRRNASEHNKQQGRSTSCVALKICCNPWNSGLCYARSTTSSHPETLKVENADTQIPYRETRVSRGCCRELPTRRTALVDR